MKKQAAGFVFLLTLLTIAVITLLVLTGMQHVLLYHKAINDLELKHQQFYQMETYATQLAQVSLTEIDPHCIVHQDSTNLVEEQLTHHQGCPLLEGRYQYLIEDLGDYPCLTSRQHDKLFSTHHRRVSLLFIDNDHVDSFIQLRQIDAIGLQTCLTEVQQVSLGVSSWRYVAV